MTISSLAAVVLAFMQTLVPLGDHAFREPREDTEYRYHALALIISQVALDDEETALEGLDRAQTALVLANVAARESAFEAAVMTCARPGLGRAWGPYQYQGPKTLACGTWRQSTRWALSMLKESFARCGRLPVVDRASFYTDGRCRPNWQRSRTRVAPALAVEVVWPYDEP